MQPAKAAQHGGTESIMNNGTIEPGDRAREGSYRVLARKYRPAAFDELVGQDAMVRTISNAFETGRIPQAWILTGVRGVGKTTTARILARALNYELADGSITGPSIRMPVLGTHCQPIMESRHIDVIEMDAASHNSVDDVRQINDAIRYAPVSARYKIYILDEVHMLSTQAFNALLKTLEEPPPHAKFIFATTEIRKVPITILSRCQRFDLRRVDAALLIEHLAGVAAKEAVQIDSEALALIARAAEGSVRDGLSLLDQGIAHAGGAVSAQHVRDMLGLADRARIIDLFESVMRGDMASALVQLRALYESGADPAVVLMDVAEFTHFVTRIKIVPAIADDPSLIEIERKQGRHFGEKLSMRVLSRAWQMLLKGIEEVTSSTRPLAAAEMVLVRIAYVADLPTPDEVIRKLEDTPAYAVENNAGRPARPAAETKKTNGVQPGKPAVSPSAPVKAELRTAAEPKARAIDRFEDLIALAAEKRDIGIKSALERDVRLVECTDGRLEIALERTAGKTLVTDLARKLEQWTGRPWTVAVSRQEGNPTVKSQNEKQQEELKSGVRAHPLVQAVLERFPGAEIVDVRKPAAAMPEETASEPELSDAVEEDEEASAFGLRSRAVTGSDEGKL
jgi:DNA polymerase III subunit gamma/tau